MNKKTILVIVGTRPEAIKLAPIILCLRECPEKYNLVICSTGQHKEMLGQAFADFNIEPDIDLGIMTSNQGLAQITSTLFGKIDDVIKNTSPEWVLVQGDTTTVMVASLCAFYRRVKVGHVEAGLRSGDKWHPFPEEVNRKIAGVVADVHFAPTTLSAENLIREGVDENRVIISGNTIVDALNCIVAKVAKERPENIPQKAIRALDDGKKLILVTGHRRESFGGAFEDICNAIADIVNKHNDVVVIYPVHLNPNVQDPVLRILSNHDRIILTQPLPYTDLVWLMSKSSFVLTDSGGIQEESVSLGKHVFVMREVTERPEGVEIGMATLVGTKRNKIVSKVSSYLSSSTDRKSSSIKNPYGDGEAAKRIVEFLERN